MKHCSNGPRSSAARPRMATLKSVLNGRERCFPLSFVHPERFFDLRAASELLSRQGGMSALPVDVSISVVQIAFGGFEDSERAACRGREVSNYLLELGRSASPQALPAGALPALEVRAYGPHVVLVSCYVEREDGFGIVEPTARALLPELGRLLAAPRAPTLAIGGARQRRVRVKGRVRLSSLHERLGSRRQAREGRARGEGGGIDRAAEECSRVLARFTDGGHAPDLAFEHNARALSGMAAASAIFGAASDVVQADGQTHAARWGGCERLVRWALGGDQLTAELEAPVALQRVRGVLNAAEIEAACDLADVDSTRALELLCASAGLIASVSGLYGDLRAAVHREVGTGGHAGALPAWSSDGRSPGDALGE